MRIHFLKSKTIIIEKKKRKSSRQTYKSTSSASLWVVALIISRATVSGAAVVSWRVAWLAVALL